ncbi:hypothetical protein HRI_000344800 [Hibiscus trionum]|uniref:Uncharacterized protein n=1 Tax=Hibiscus trionum TaxID=183268 RepID=A0A9W7LKM1_HIBTR|nr:hypothetical protein HRI_000344800 [Hibiscus trionum]
MKVKPFHSPENEDDDDNGTNGSLTFIDPPDVAAYASWLVKHPSALNTFDSITKEEKGNRVVVFLDSNLWGFPPF